MKKTPVIFDNGELKITAFRVVHEPIEHCPDNLGFKFEYKTLWQDPEF